MVSTGPSAPRLVNVEASVDIMIAAAAPDDVLTRVTGPGGDEWRLNAYSLYTEADVLEHWARNAVANGTVDACQLDGWADLPAEAVTFSVSVDYAEVAWHVAS